MRSHYQINGRGRGLHHLQQLFPDLKIVGLQKKHSSSSVSFSMFLFIFILFYNSITVFVADSSFRAILFNFEKVLRENMSINVQGKLFYVHSLQVSFSLSKC